MIFLYQRYRDNWLLMSQFFLTYRESNSARAYAGNTPVDR